MIQINNNYFFNIKKVKINNNIIKNMTNFTTIKSNHCNSCDDNKSNIDKNKEKEITRDIIKKNIDNLNYLNETLFSKLPIINNLKIEIYNSNTSNLKCNNC
jgi:hypothetical protein